MPFPIRENDDKGVLRTDGSVDQTQAYTNAEKIFDQSNQPSAQPRDDGSAAGYQHKQGVAGSSGTHQSHQQETSTNEDPSKAVHDADPTDV